MCRSAVHHSSRCWELFLLLLTVPIRVWQALDHMLEDKNIARPMYLVAHGFITGQYTVTWALAHQEAVAKLVIMDVPLRLDVRIRLRGIPLDRLPHRRRQDVTEVVRVEPPWLWQRQSLYLPMPRNHGCLEEADPHWGCRLGFSTPLVRVRVELAGRLPSMMVRVPTSQRTPARRIMAPHETAPRAN